jgi:hypothetical protein
MTTLNGQLIGQAERATRAVFDRVLEAEHTGFEPWVVLNQLDLDGGSAEEDDLVLRIDRALKSPGAAQHAVEELVADGRVIRRNGSVELTAAGVASRARIRGGIDAITSRLYGDLPASDLEVAGRILSIVAERADAELTSVGSS